MTVLILPIDPRSRAVEMLPRRAFEASLYHRCTLGVERLLIFDQQIRKLPSADLHAYRVQHLQDFGLTHLSSRIQSQHPGSDPRSKLAMVACWQFRQLRRPMAG